MQDWRVVQPPTWLPAAWYKLQIHMMATTRGGDFSAAPWLGHCNQLGFQSVPGTCNQASFPFAVLVYALGSFRHEPGGFATPLCAFFSFGQLQSGIRFLSQAGVFRWLRHPIGLHHEVLCVSGMRSGIGERQGSGATTRSEGKSTDGRIHVAWPSYNLFWERGSASHPPRWNSQTEKTAPAAAVTVLGCRIF